MTESDLHTAVDLVQLAVEHGVTIGTAESLTGGSLAAAIVDVPGASNCLEGGVVSYSHAVKERTLGVSHDLLESEGAVAPEVARAMARGARAALEVDWAVSTTGVAGPDPHDGQAVGTVYIAVSGPRGEQHLELHMDGGRAAIRSETVSRAIEFLASQIELTDNFQ
ncbi:CinA family protein [Kocuria sp. cx-455]|uniref:CinA family protein n=1 Tax=unclassified Candidatus Sulfotelmatobacter TaxID=2635724 RepID=UPI0016891BB8|nr:MULTISPECIES: CinA family protein [unclassified Candidatus Sulfotelmatobacter]MBD2762609.1 CinA family protein [Kocuria sp. cx-116]MBD2765345.1 CinA family protein [Kocuria sp. cx-455]